MCSSDLSVYPNGYQQDVYPPDYVYPQPQETTNYGTGTVIPEDLNQPMVGPNSAYGSTYALGPNGPYDTTNINDPRHPDNPNNRPQVPGVTPNETRPESETGRSAGYLRSIGDGGAGINSYYDEINAYLANHSQDEIQQAMGTYGVSQDDVDNARNYQFSTAQTPEVVPDMPQTPEVVTDYIPSNVYRGIEDMKQPQYARGGLSRMLRKVR